MCKKTTPPDGPELVASAHLLLKALRSTPGLVGVPAVVLMLVVTYHRTAAADLGLVPREWSLFGWVGLNLLCLLLVPIVLIMAVMRDKLGDYGLALGDWRIWTRHAAAYLAVCLPVIAAASRLEAFRSYYPMFHLARERPLLLLPWELAYGAYFFAWEFFFRGYLLQGFARRFGAGAIVIQTVPFVMMHFGKPELEVGASVIAGLLLGVTAYRSRSIIGCWLIHWTCAAAMDVLALM